MNMEISWNNMTILELFYILSNNNGYLDGDKKTIEIEVDKNERK